jgi:hypothetical protein
VSRGLGQIQQGCLLVIRQGEDTGEWWGPGGDRWGPEPTSSGHGERPVVDAQEQIRSSPEDCLPLVQRLPVALVDVPILFRGMGTFRVTARRGNEVPSAHHGFVSVHNAVAGPSG